MKKAPEPTLKNVVKSMTKRLGDFKGESRRSYQKALGSFQEFLIGHYPMERALEADVVENWIFHNLIHGLSPKTVGFYLDKIASLYSATAPKLKGGRTPLFKEVKERYRSIDLPPDLPAKITETVGKVRLWKSTHPDSLLVKCLEAGPPFPSSKQSLYYLWTCLALNSGILPDTVKGLLTEAPPKMPLLNLCTMRTASPQEAVKICQSVAESMQGEEKQWFAMRLRPRVSYDMLLQRFSILSDHLKMPELFYPCEEIAKRTGGKMVWADRPVIRDVVFFKKRKSEIYTMFSKIFDLAWCYRRPGVKPGNYAPIPSKAMEEFRKAIGFLTPDFEVSLSSEYDLKPGEEVVILDTKYMEEHGRILKKPAFDKDGNKIYRVMLLNSFGRWDISLDARLIKKVNS